jgi:hypothetical protein
VGGCFKTGKFGNWIFEKKWKTFEVPLIEEEAEDVAAVDDLIAVWMMIELKREQAVYILKESYFG